MAKNSVWSSLYKRHLWYFFTNIQKKVYVKKIAEIRLFGQDERFIGRSRNITSWQKLFQALLKLFLEVLSFLKSCSKLLKCSLCDLGTIVGYKCYSFTSANFEQILFKEKHGIGWKNNFWAKEIHGVRGSIWMTKDFS